MDGTLSFDALQMRLHPAASRIERLSRETPASLILFDCLLKKAGQPLLALSFEERRAAVEALFAEAGEREGLLLTPFTRDLRKAEAWLAGRHVQVDGVMAKRLDLPYLPGERAMLKVKHLRTADCVVGGFRYESGSRRVGSLLLGLYDDRGLLHHVGFTSAIADHEKPELTARLEKLIAPPGFTGNAPGGPSRWSTARSAEWQPLRPRAGGGGALRPRHERPFPPWHQARALAAGQGAHAVHVRAVAARGNPAGIAVNGERSPGASLEDRRAQAGRATGQAAGTERLPRRGDAPRAPRLRGRGPAVAQRQRPGAQCWLLRMVLLALAGQLLPAGLRRPTPGSATTLDHFSTVELNAPFYSWPTVATVESWLRQCDGRPFVYTVKVNELITHTRRFEGTERLVRDFGLIADLLGPHMGCLLFQLPPSFHYTAARLDSIVGQLDPRRRNVVEFRHRSWWHEDVYDAFREAGIIFCSCSGPRLPDELIKTADDVYLRFHGTTNWYRHDYTAEELEVWAARVRECRPAHVWAYFNNDREAHAIRNADAFRQLLDDV